jgi:hypothetical protein
VESFYNLNAIHRMPLPSMQSSTTFPALQSSVQIASVRVVTATLATPAIVSPPPIVKQAVAMPQSKGVEIAPLGRHPLHDTFVEE